MPAKSPVNLHIRGKMHNRSRAAGSLPAVDARARGGIGRRARLRALCPQGRAGSTPVGPSLKEKPFGHPKGFFISCLTGLPIGDKFMDRREFLTVSAAAGALVLPHALRAAERNSNPKARS